MDKIKSDRYLMPIHKLCSDCVHNFGYACNHMPNPCDKDNNYPVYFRQRIN